MKRARYLSPERTARWLTCSVCLALLAGCGADLSKAAKALGCTSSQLTKLLKLEPRAIGEVNRRRTELGLRKLK